MAEPYLSSELIPQQRLGSVIPPREGPLLSCSCSPRVHCLVVVSLPCFFPGSWRFDNNQHECCLILTNAFIFFFSVMLSLVNTVPSHLCPTTLPTPHFVTVSVARDSPVSLS